MSDNNSCFTCEYYSEFDGVCCNSDSEHCADFIDGENVCDKYTKTIEQSEDVPLQCINGSCPIALSDEYEERGMDVVHNCNECPYCVDKEQQILKESE